MAETYEITRKQIYILVTAMLIMLGLAFLLGVRVGNDIPFPEPVPDTKTIIDQLNPGDPQMTKTAQVPVMKPRGRKAPTVEDDGLTFYDKLKPPKTLKTEEKSALSPTEAPAKTAPPPTPAPQPTKSRSASPKTESSDIPPAVESGYAIQVGAFSREKKARSLQRRLAKKGYPVYVSRVRFRNRRVSYRVRVGPFETQSEANRIADRLKSEDRLRTWVLKTKRGQ